MTKTIRNGMVAVLYSSGYGAGWSTWNLEIPEMLFDSGLVDLVESKADNEKLEAYCTLKWPEAYLGGLEGIGIEWLPVGTAFRIHEYDGSESVEIRDKIDWTIA